MTWNWTTNGRRFRPSRSARCLGTTRGGSVLLLVNVDSAPIHARIGCKGIVAEQIFEAPGTGSFTASADRFEMTCTPYDVRVIHLSPK